jgi:hypothetical protein
MGPPLPLVDLYIIIPSVQFQIGTVPQEKLEKPIDSEGGQCYINKGLVNTNPCFETLVSLS